MTPIRQLSSFKADLEYAVKHEESTRDAKDRAETRVANAQESLGDAREVANLDLAIFKESCDAYENFREANLHLLEGDATMYALEDIVLAKTKNKNLRDDMIQKLMARDASRRFIVRPDRDLKTMEAALARATSKHDAALEQLKRIQAEEELSQ